MSASGAVMTTRCGPRLGSEWFVGSELTRIPCGVTTIDATIRAGKEPPVLLKLDVEGHEAAVLDGALDLLSGDAAPAMIQFEYGETWLRGNR